MNTRSSLLGVALELLAMFALGKLDVLILVHLYIRERFSLSCKGL